MHRTDPQTPAPPFAGLSCLACVIDRKSAEAKGHTEAELPPLRPAITLVGSPLGPLPHCYEHIEVKVHSPLAVAPPNALAGLQL